MIQLKNNRVLKSFVLATCAIATYVIATSAITSLGVQPQQFSILSSNIVDREMDIENLEEAIFKINSKNQGLENLLKTFRQTLSIKRHKQENISTVSFSPDGKTIASANPDNTIKLWSADGRLIKALEGHRDLINSIKFTPDSKTIASASDDQTIKLWGIDTIIERNKENYNNELQIISTIQAYDELQTIRINQPSTVLSTCENGKTITFADDKSSVIILQGGYTYSTLNEDSDIQAVAANCQNIVTADNKGVIKIQNSSGELQQQIKDTYGRIENVSLSPNGNMIASVYKNRSIVFRNIDGQELKTFKSTKDANGVKISHDGKKYAITYEDGTVELRDFRDDKLILTFTGNSNGANSIDFNPHNNTFVIGGSDGTLQLFDTNNGNFLHSLKGHTNKIDNVNYNANGNVLTSKCNHSIKKWNLKNPFTYVEPNIVTIIMVLVVSACGSYIIYFIRFKHLQKTQNPKKSSSQTIAGWIVYVLPEDWYGNLEALRYEMIAVQKPCWYINLITTITLVDMLRAGVQIKWDNLLNGEDEMAAIGRRSISEKLDELTNKKNKM